MGYFIEPQGVFVLYPFYSIRMNKTFKIDILCYNKSSNKKKYKKILDSKHLKSKTVKKYIYFVKMYQ